MEQKVQWYEFFLEIVFWRILIHFLEGQTLQQEIDRLRVDVNAKESKISELEQDITTARDSQLSAFRTEIDTLCAILEEIASLYHGAPDDGDALRGRDERIASLMKKLGKHGHPITRVEAEVLKKTSDQLSEKLERLVRELDGWKKKEKEMARREIEMENRLADYELPFKVSRYEEEMDGREACEVQLGHKNTEIAPLQPELRKQREALSAGSDEWKKKGAEAMENRWTDYESRFKVLAALPQISDQARSGGKAKNDIVKELENQLKEARDEQKR